MAATRRVFDGDCFADVPVAGTEWLGRDACVRLGNEEKEEGPAVLLRGRVLHAEGEFTLASCGGLLARVRRTEEHAMHSPLAIVVRQRA